MQQVQSSVLWAELIALFYLPNPSSRAIVQDSTDPVKKMSTRILAGSKAWPALKNDKLTGIRELIV
jgi:hypothetical protein